MGIVRSSLVRLRQACSFGSGAVLRAKSRFRRDVSAAAAVEFALILPIMLTLWLGSVEVAHMLTVKRKVDLVARTLSDLTSRIPEDLTQEKLKGVVDAIGLIMEPVDPEPLDFRLSSIAIASEDPKELVSNTNSATVCWSITYNDVYTGFNRTMQRSPQGKQISTTEMPLGFRLKETSYIRAEVKYTYSPIASWLFKNSITVESQMFMHPRYQRYMAYPDPTNPSKRRVPPTVGAKCEA